MFFLFSFKETLAVNLLHTHTQPPASVCCVDYSKEMEAKQYFGRLSVIGSGDTSSMAHLNMESTLVPTQWCTEVTCMEPQEVAIILHPAGALHESGLQVFVFEQ